ncbi:MAG: tetratricopeptide repeat protein [Acidobacteriota bacterium]|nr:tetratricopeptide repeat protein [Acidobacteriota bacterium]
MYYNLCKSPPLILLICFLFTVVTPAYSQKRTGSSPGVTPVIFLDSTREQDGLVGPVRRVQTETAKLETKSGLLTEAPRQVLEVTTYNLKGERVDNTSYPVPGPSGSEEYKHDENGNIVEMTLRSADGSIISREVYSYEKDGVGNWIKMTTSLVLFEDGKLRYEPVEATYRAIAYFYDETIAKLLGAPATASNPALSAPPAPLRSRSAEAKKPAENANASVPATKPVVDSTSPKRIEDEKTAGIAEGTKVESRAHSNNSGSKSVEAPKGTGTVPNSSRPAPETVAKKSPEISSPSSTYKAAFDLYKSGREQFNSGNVAGAIVAFQQALEVKPDFADVHLSLGHAYLRLKKSQEAIKAFQEATRINPEMEEAYYGLGLEYFRAGKMKDAAQAFKKAVNVRPSMAKAHYGLALAYQEMGKQDQLIEEYRILQTLDAQLAKKLSDSFPEFNLPCGGRRCD